MSRFISKIIILVFMATTLFFFIFMQAHQAQAADVTLTDIDSEYGETTLELKSTDINPDMHPYRFNDMPLDGEKIITVDEYISKTKEIIGQLRELNELLHQLDLEKIKYYERLIKMHQEE